MAAERTEGLIKNFLAGGALNDGRIVIFGNDDDTVVQAANSTTRSIGISIVPQGTEYPVRHGEAIPTVALATGDHVDVVMSGIADVVYGGSVTRGAALTADANGRAVAVSLPPAAGTFIIGFATVNGALNEYGCVFLSPHFVRGA